MKKAFLVVFLLFAVQTWGVVGAAMTMKLSYTCTLKVGPLCYGWEESRLAKILGKERLSKMEDSLLKQRDDFADKIADKMSGKSGELDKALEQAGDALKGMFDKAVEGSK